MSQWDTIKILKNQMNIKQVANDIADFVIMDLEDEGFKARLEKNNSKKPKNWKIVPIGEYSKSEINKFNKIKDERTEFYKQRTKNQINQMKESLGLKIRIKNKK